MTNTLHRFGKPESLKNDYIVFSMASKDINDEGALEKVKKFLTAAIKYGPINMGNALTGPMYRPEKDLDLYKLYGQGRKEKVSLDQVIADLSQPGSAAVVFDNKQAMDAFLKEAKEMDLGISINISSLVDDARDACKKAGVVPHSVEYSLGFLGDTYRMPDRHVLALTTMCGHGMISASFAKKVISRVKEGRLTPDKGAGYMAKFCVCGVFNTTRAVQILNEARKSN